MPLSKKVVVDILTTVLTNDRTRTFIQSPAFWPIAVKGGFECTLRDFILYDLQSALTEKFSRKSYICTGERSWGGRSLRGDILLFDKRQINGRGNISTPLAEVELKVNFGGQVDKAKRGDNKNYPTRSIATLKKIIGAKRKRKTKKVKSNAKRIIGIKKRRAKAVFVAVQFIHQLYDCNPIDASLALRYSEYRNDRADEREPAQRFADLIERKHEEISSAGYGAREIAKYQLADEDGASGEMIALASWAKRRKRKKG